MSEVDEREIFWRTEMLKKSSRSEAASKKSEIQVMITMNKSQALFTNAVNEFWSFVERAERDVRENSHLGRLPPCCAGDPWDETFAKAYEALAPYLKRFRRIRYFQIPAGLAFFYGPLGVESAHQALMFFLNPVGELYGEQGVLDSTEYIAIKEAAMAELEKRQQAQLKAKGRPKCTKDSKTVSELTDLKAHLRDHLLSGRDEAPPKALKLRDIQDHFGWSQAKVTRRMQTLFKSPKAMDSYNAIFASHEPDKGYKKVLDDSTLDVDALWLDRLNDEEDDEQCSIVR